MGELGHRLVASTQEANRAPCSKPDGGCVLIGYGDEPGASWVMSARPVFEAYQKEGFKFIIAGGNAVFYKAGYAYDFHNVAKDPAPEVSLLDINLLGTVIAVRPYCHTDHYWQVYFDTNEAIIRVGKEAGWPAPTPTQIMKTTAA